MKENQLSSNELLQKAKERSGLSKEVLRQSLYSLLGVISEALDDGKCIVLDNFGSFDLRTVKKTHSYTSPSQQQTSSSSRTSGCSIQTL